MASRRASAAWFRLPSILLNLAGRSSSGGDDLPEALDENRRRFLAAMAATIDAPNAGVAPTVAAIHQVHGAEVAVVDSAWDARTLGGAPAADAAITRERGRALLVRVADCVPLLLACPRTGAVAAIHAGWRGIVAGVIGATIHAMRRHFDVDPAHCVAAIGPCIGVDAFEVGEEVATSLAEIGLASTIRRGAAWPRPHVDLFAAARHQLVAAGVSRARIDGEPLCTSANRDLFFSHRRDNGRTGRMAAAIIA
ncbi:MAG: peptidoglycan editing factor PgeF [Phycisphaerales bacterium]